MALVDTKVIPFSASAFHDGQFIDVSEKDIEGKWAVFFFLPCRLHVCLSYRVGRLSRPLFSTSRAWC